MSLCYNANNEIHKFTPTAAHRSFQVGLEAPAPKQIAYSSSGRPLKGSVRQGAPHSFARYWEQEQQHEQQQEQQQRQQQGRRRLNKRSADEQADSDSDDFPAPADAIQSDDYDDND